MTTFWDLYNSTAPGTPSSNYGRVYVAIDGTLHFINDAGVDTQLGAGGGGGGGGLGLYGLNNGIGLGTGTSLDVVGNRLVLSISGTRFNLTNSPDPAELIGVFGLANGSPLGTGTWIDFGNNLTATISGTTLRLDASAGGGGGINVLAFQEKGAFKVSGTVANFIGSGVVSSSGTIARIDLDGNYLRLNTANSPLLGVLSISGSYRARATSGQDNYYLVDFSSNTRPNVGTILLEGAGTVTADVKNYRDDGYALIVTHFISGTSSSAPLSINKQSNPLYGSNISDLFPAIDIYVTNIPPTVKDFGGALNYTDEKQTRRLQLNPAATGSSSNYIFDTSYGMPTGSKILDVRHSGTFVFGVGKNGEPNGLAFSPYANGRTLVVNTGTAAGYSLKDRSYTIEFILGDGVKVVPLGITGSPYIEVPSDSVIDSWAIVADATGTLIANILQSNYANFPPSSPLAGLGQPILNNARKNTENATGTAFVSQGDWLVPRVDSSSTIEQATLSLRLRKV